MSFDWCDGPNTNMVPQNNSAAVFGAEGTADAALPPGVDTTLLDCLNRTIGAEAEVFDAGFSWRLAGDHGQFTGLFFFFGCFWWWFSSCVI
jgi:hypothetical protein